jgi:hypothetical protein
MPSPHKSRYCADEFSFHSCRQRAVSGGRRFPLQRGARRSRHRGALLSGRGNGTRSNTGGRTHITQPSPKTVFYRDSLGRTRIERTFPLPPGASGPAGPNMIEISDPVSGAHYTLDPRSRTARKVSFPSTPPPPPTGTMSTSQRLAVPAPIPALSVSSPDNQPARPQLSHESLGTHTIDGILAEGVRTTVTFPIGPVGNDRPITTVSETWTSPALKTVSFEKTRIPVTANPQRDSRTSRAWNLTRRCSRFHPITKLSIPSRRVGKRHS